MKYKSGTFIRWNKEELYLIVDNNVLAYVLMKPGRSQFLYWGIKNVDESLYMDTI